MHSSPNLKNWIINSPNIATNNQKIGILGGSFNPAHDGHIEISNHAIKKFDLDFIWWVISPKNPLKTYDRLYDFNERLDKAKSIVHNNKIIVTEIEQKIGSQYTIGTINYLTKKHPNTKFIWIMGADNAKDFHLWKKWESILGMLPIAIIDRPRSSLDVTSSLFAIKHKKYRIDEADSQMVFKIKKPSWVYLHNKLNDSSSTKIRSNDKI
tara:strand:- start:1778 stop:2407 length:630 start_codon:yes stop_codon:yes gene_type:complete